MVYPRLNNSYIIKDPLFGQVIFLAHYDTNFVGVVQPAAPVTGGGPLIDTVAPLVGAGSYQSAAINSNVAYATSPGGTPQFALNGALTVEATVQFNTVGGTRDFICTSLIDASYFFTMSVNSSGQFACTLRGSGINSGSGVFNLGQVYRVALCIAAGAATARLFIDGVIVATTPFSAVGGTGVPNGFFIVGNNVNVNGAKATDRFDEIRVTKAERYTTNYTPVSIFPDA